MAEQPVESTIRSRAQALGYVVRKSRRKNHTNWDRGGYNLLHIETHIHVVGVRFDATLPEVGAFLARGVGNNGAH